MSANEPVDVSWREPEKDEEEPIGGAGGHRSFLTIVLGVLAAAIVYRLLRVGHLEHTSLVFMGVPAVIAVVIALMPQPKTITGLILKATTIALMLSGVVFGEGFVCVLFASPLFFLVGAIIGRSADWMRSYRRRQRQVRMTMMVVLLFGPTSLEGVIPGFEFERHAEVTRSRVVDGTAAQVEAALAETPRFERELPKFLQLRFPTPGIASGAGLDVGDERRVEFPYHAHGQHVGALTLRVAAHTPGHVTFEPTADDSHITHWLSWRTIDVEWRELTPGRTEVSWTLRYRRRLDPAWYFDPLERYGAGLVAGYLIDTLATPRPAAPGASASSPGGAIGAAGASRVDPLRLGCPRPSDLPGVSTSTRRVATSTRIAGLPLSNASLAERVDE